MIAIVDGGSTKCDWVILQTAGNKVLQTKTKGFNPNNIEEDQIPAEISSNQDLYIIKDRIKYLFFYGSGCGVEENKLAVKKQLEKVFTVAEIEVQEDLMAAAFAAYRGQPAMVGILGTGSNSCYFDGITMKVELPSLGFLLGDDGSGNAMGKRLVKNYFMKKLPEEIAKDFKHQYRLTIEQLLIKMYKESDMVNAYFAAFNRFVAKWKEHPFIQKMISDELRGYVEYQLLPYEQVHDAEINFIGSIAYYYSDLLQKVVEEYGLRFGAVIQKPIESLVDYHQKYIFPRLEGRK